MTHARPDPVLDSGDAFGIVPRLPSWIIARRGDDPEIVAFLSGAALGHLHLVSRYPKIPLALWRERLALGAAEACTRLLGRSERASELRDEVHLLRPGDQPGPAGAVFVAWRQAVARRISAAALQNSLPAHSADQIAAWRRPGNVSAGQGGPVARAAAVLETVLAEAPREEAAALILADAALARALGWTHLVPLLGQGMPRRALRATGAELRFACHVAVVAAAAEAVGMADELARRAVRLRAVAPKLRAKQADAAVELFLSRDALSPSIGLSGLMSDRAARRLCDRLVSLGVLRELTGRDTFRFYGL